MHTGTYYLNNTGSKWAVFDSTGRRETQTFTTKAGKQITRRVNYYEAFGNFATANISYKGRKISVFLDTILED